MDPEVAKRRTLLSEPLGALMWLKSDEVMKMHATWKSNDQVTSQKLETKVIPRLTLLRSVPNSTVISRYTIPSSHSFHI